MSTRKTSCQAVLNGKVKYKGKPMLDHYDDKGKPVYICWGWIDPMYDEPLDECAACPKHWRNA